MRPKDRVFSLEELESRELLAASAIQTLFQSGQTFITWAEDVAVVGEGYNVYRSDQAITTENLAQAELLTSRWGPLDDNTSAYTNERARGANAVQQNFIITDLGQQLSNDTGLFVYTAKGADQAYYAITQVVNGVEDRTIVAGQNATTAAVSEVVDQAKAIMVKQTDSGRGMVFTQFMDYDQWNPTFEGYAYNFSVSLPTGYDGSQAAPLMVYAHGWGGRYGLADGTPYNWNSIYVQIDDPKQTWYFGFAGEHDYRTGPIPTSGPIVNFTEQRILLAIDQVAEMFNVDRDRIHGQGSSMGGSGMLALGMRYANVFSAVFAGMPMTNYQTSGSAGGLDWVPDAAKKWGSVANNLEIESRGKYAEPLAKYDGTGVWDWQNHQKQLVDRAGDDMAYIVFAHTMQDNTIDWETQGQPFVESLYAGNIGFAGAAVPGGHSWPGFAGTNTAMIGGPGSFDGWGHFLFERDMSFVAIANASGSSPAPAPTSTTTSYYYNKAIEWSVPWNNFHQSIVDQADRYEITLRSTSGTQTADVTPRRLQQFQVAPGQTFLWENRSAANDSVVASGTVTADANGLITIVGFTITQGGNRLILFPTGGTIPNEAPVADFNAKPKQGQAPLVVSFDASASHDVDGQIVSYVWDFGDGSNGSGNLIDKTYAAAGLYSVTLTVTDHLGATDSFSRTVLVAAPDAGGAFELFPLTTSTIGVFADQLPTNLTDEMVQFIGTHYAGSQKLLPEQIELIRQINPEFLLLHYRLATSSGPQPYIYNGNWGSDWSYVSSNDEWFLTNSTTGQRLYNSQWDWYQNDIDNPEWREYWLNQTIADMRTTGAQAVFADSFDAGIGGFWYVNPDQRFTGTNAANPSFWPDGVPWTERLSDLIQYMVDGLSNTEEDFLYIPNIGPLVTAWANIDYTGVDGAMLEGFGEWGPSYLKGSASDWTLAMNRALPLSQLDKVLIVQPSLLAAADSPDGLRHRSFIMGSYLLLKGDHTYLNIIPQSAPGVGAYYFPEYDIDLGAAVTPLASDVSEYLWNGAYRREFEKGMVLVNSSEQSITLTLDEYYQRVTASGGGSLNGDSIDENGNYVGGKLLLDRVQQITLAPGSSVILLNDAFDELGPVTNLQGAEGNGQVSLSWTAPDDSSVDGFRVVRQVGHPPTSISDGVVVYEGSQTNVVDHGLVNGVTVYYKVFSYTSEQYFRYSSPESAPELTATPRAAAGVNTIVVQNAVDNHLTNLQSTTANLGGRTTLQFFKSTAGEYRTLMDFDLASLPPGAEILDARIELYHLSAQYNNIPLDVSLYTMSRGWEEGNGQSHWGTASGSSWLNADSGSSWATPGGDINTTTDFGYGANGLVSSTTVPRFEGAGWVGFDATAAIKAWLDGSLDNEGFALIISGGLNSEHAFASSEYFDSALAPRLIVTVRVNQSPTASPQSVETNEDQPAAITLAASDPDGSAITQWEIVSGPAHGTLTGSGADLTYTPAANYYGADSFTFRVFDGTTWSEVANVDLLVRSINDAPILSPIADQVVGQGGTVTFHASAQDADTSDSLVYSLGEGAPAGASIDPTTGVFVWTPGASVNPGQYLITVRATDDGSPALSASQTFRVNVVSSGPSLAIEDVTITEQDSGQSIATFTVRLSQPSSQTVSVKYSTVSATDAAHAALLGTDYYASSGELTFKPGQTTATISVKVLGDSRDEFNETFYVDLSNAKGAAISKARAVGTIVDNDAAPVATVTSASNSEYAYGTRYVTFRIDLSAASDKPVTIQYATADASRVAAAQAGVDYVAASGFLTIAPGQKSATIAIQVLDDMLDEFDETFFLNLLSADHAVLATAQAIGTIRDDDPTPALSTGSLTFTQLEDGSFVANFSLALAAASGKPITVEYVFAEESSIFGSAGVVQRGVLTFEPGATSASFSFPLGTDARGRRFSVTLSNPTNATLPTSKFTSVVAIDSSAELASPNDPRMIDEVLRGLDAEGIDELDWLALV